jgi:hypothetical protein
MLSSATALKSAGARLLSEFQAATHPGLRLREPLRDLRLRVAAELHLVDGLGDLGGREVVTTEVLGEHRELRVVLVPLEEGNGDVVEGGGILLADDPDRLVPPMAGDEDVAVPDLGTVRKRVRLALHSLVPDDEVLEEAPLADVLDELGDLPELEADVAEDADLDPR